MTRRLVAATFGALLLSGTALAADITVFTAAPGQDALKITSAQSAKPGAKTLDLTVGVGSAIFVDRSGPTPRIFTVGDRGPNFTCDEAKEPMGLGEEEACPAAEATATTKAAKAGKGRIYPTPDYAVSIYEIALDPATKTFRVVSTTPLKTPTGEPVTGIPNPLKVATTDFARDIEGVPLPLKAAGIDAEGLVRLPDGRFFIAEENATGIAEVAPDGTVVRRFVPAGTEQDFKDAGYPVVGSLPALLARRNANRGLESLALGADGQTLFTMVQNPLANPDADTYKQAVNTRLIKLSIGKDGDATTLTPVAEYVYTLEDWQTFKAAGAKDAKQPSSLRISEMTQIGGDRFLVDERTDQVAKLFEIDLSGATNILGGDFDAAATVPTLEQVEDLAVVGITPVKKTERLVASSLKDAKPRFPEKIEGLGLLPDGRLLIVNDNDFGIVGAETEFVIVDGLTLGK